MAATVAPPLVSIVATSRNDDHGRNLLGRMQTFVNALVAQCRRHGLPAELVLVEWNPPEDRPRLRRALRWPADCTPCQVRIIEVPHALHRRFRHAEALPLFQMIGKNVGIRRARGRFILATNIDVLFPDALMNFLKSRAMRSGVMYRVDRVDVAGDVPVDAAVDDQLRYCRRNLLRVNARDGTFSCTTPLRTWLRRSLRRCRRLAGHVKRGLWTALTGRRRPRPEMLHINACGDFTLMERQHWFDVRGYPEFECYSMNIDALLCFQAHHAGAREVVLPPAMGIYHIEHEIGSGWTPEGECRLRARLEARGIPWLEIERVLEWAVQMRVQDTPLLFNSPTWGLSDEHLPETIVGAARHCAA